MFDRWHGQCGRRGCTGLLTTVEGISYTNNGPVWGGGGSSSWGSSTLPGTALRPGTEIR